jgi:hypothetical protein
MSPILGIMASQNYPRITDSYESISTVTVGGGGSATVSFTSIPATYKHLQIRASAKAVNNDQGYFMQFNSDTGTNYNTHLLYGNGASVTALSNNTWAGMDIASTSSSNFSAIVVDILDYTDTNKNTTIRSLSGVDNNGSGYATLASGLWRNTAAVTSLTIREILGGGNITEFSSFALYGIKG